MSIKKLVKKKIENIVDSSYRRSIADAMPSFDEWIRNKESTLERFDMTVDLIDKDVPKEDISRLSYSTLYKATSLRIIPYEHINDKFNIKHYIEDILVFVNGELTDRAVPLIASKFLQKPEVSIVYGDEDIAELDTKNTEKYGRSIYGTRRDPLFKPEWSPNAFLDHFYFCNVVAIRRSSFRDFQWSYELSGAESLYRTLLRFVFDNEYNLRKSVDNIDEILIHSKSYSLAGLKDKSASEYVSHMICVGDYKISAVIPSKDNPLMLLECIKSFSSAFEDDSSYEVIVVDNGSTEENRNLIKEFLAEYNAKYIYAPMEFNFSRQSNLGAKEATGNFVLLLNDDVIFRDKETLSEMIKQASLSFTGAVGVKLLYPDSDMIQHAGVITNRIGPVHKLQFLCDKDELFHGFNRGVQNVSAVTAACLLMRKDVFDKLEGLDENLRIAFNDVDLCYRLLENGYANVVCNNVYAVHTESVSRGKDTDSESLMRLETEKERLYSIHKAFRGYDPYYSKYLLSDCLDVRAVPANEYEYEKALEHSKPIKKELPSGAREDSCVQLSLEYAGDKQGFTFREDDSNELLFQGFAYVQGSNNACYRKNIVLSSDDITYCIPYRGAIRNDVFVACCDQVNVEKSGFCVDVERNAILKGRYRVGVLFENKVAREKLYIYSNKYLVVK